MRCWSLLRGSTHTLLLPLEQPTTTRTSYSCWVLSPHHPLLKCTHEQPLFHHSCCAGKDKGSWTRGQVCFGGESVIVISRFPQCSQGQCKLCLSAATGCLLLALFLDLPLEGDPLSRFIAPTTQPHHVWVVPVARSSYWLQHVLVCKEPVQDGKYTVPGVLNVIVVTPEVADLCQDGVVHLERSTDSDRREKKRGLQGWGEGTARLVDKKCVKGGAGEHHVMKDEKVLSQCD